MLRSKECHDELRNPPRISGSLRFAGGRPCPAGVRAPARSRNGCRSYAGLEAADVACPGPCCHGGRQDPQPAEGRIPVLRMRHGQEPDGGLHWFMPMRRKALSSHRHVPAASGRDLAGRVAAGFPPGHDRSPRPGKVAGVAFLSPNENRRNRLGSSWARRSPRMALTGGQQPIKDRRGILRCPDCGAQLRRRPTGKAAFSA